MVVGPLVSGEELCLLTIDFYSHAWKPELKEWVQIPQAVLNGSVPREQAGF
jgi:hypothetical protein